MTYETMKKEELKTCVGIAAKAFEKYDFFSIYFPNDKSRPHLLHNMMKVEIGANFDRAHFLTAKENGKIVAFAMLRDPEYQEPDAGAYMRAGFWKNYLFGGKDNVAAWLSMDSKAGIPCKNLSGRTWFLNILTVAADVEGKGIGSRMIREGIIPYVKEHGGEALSLYTNSEINRRFYTKNGFQEFHEQHFSYNGKELGSWSYLMTFSSCG